jgi:DIE2/ALG10 family
VSTTDLLVDVKTSVAPKARLRVTDLVATPLRRALLVTACWRLLIGLWGIVAHGLVAKGPTASRNLMHLGWPRNPLTLFVDAGVRQDAFWYAGIAQHGYTYSTRHLSSIVFYPLFPLLVKATSLVTGNVFAAGMLVSTVWLFTAVFFLFMWLDQRGMRNSSALAVGLMLCFPFGFFWASMYTESLFLTLALATFVFFERGRWQLSAVCAFGAVMCRPTGLILAPCLAVMILVQSSRFKVQGSRFKGVQSSKFKVQSSTFNVRRSKEVAGSDGTGTEGGTRNGRDESRPYGLGAVARWAPVIAGPLAFCMFAAYQWLAFGTPFASINAEAVAPFSRSASQALSDLLLRRHGFPPWFLVLMLLFGLIFLAAVPMVYRRFGPAYALFAALAVIFPMTSGLTSLERYVMIDFPVFAAVATMGSRRVPLAVMTLGFYALLGFMALFVAGYTII